MKTEQEERAEKAIAYLAANDPEGGPPRIARLLWAYRKSEGLTMQAFADNLHYAGLTMNEFESGRIIPSPTQAWELGTALGFGGTRFAERAVEEEFARVGILATVKIDRIK